MKKSFAVIAALFAATPILLAQEDQTQKPKAGQEQQGMPDPKHKEHDALKAMAGTWECTVKTEAMPGVPGMEKASTSTATERAELLCNGLWLKSTISGTNMGQPFEGLWLAGYDPQQKGYTSIWVENGEPVPCTMSGSYDAGTKTWTWTGSSEKGKSRSVCVHKDADTSIETCYLTPTGSDKEVQCMEITRKRVKGAVPVAATAHGDAGKAVAPKALQREVGEWNASVKVTGDPSQPSNNEKGTESVRPILGGKCVWSDFHGTMMGMPFEGHGLLAYDEANKQLVSYWIDSTMAGIAVGKGSFDPDSDTVTMDGTCPDGMGGPAMTTKQTVTYDGDDKKVMRMEFSGARGKMTVDVTYQRKGS